MLRQGNPLRQVTFFAWDNAAITAFQRQRISELFVGNNLTPQIQAYLESKGVDLTIDDTLVRDVILYPSGKFSDIFEDFGGRNKSPLGQLFYGSVVDRVVLSDAQLICGVRIRMSGGTFSTTQCDGDSKAQVGDGNTDQLPVIVEPDRDILAFNGIIHRVSGVLVPTFTDFPAQ